MNRLKDWGVFRLHVGDCRNVLREMAEASVDSIVTDPPYGLGFMGNGWDSFSGRRESGARAGSGDRGVLPGYGRGGTSEDRFKYRQREAKAYGRWCDEWATECLRVLKPGGHLLAFSGTRTYHRMVCAIEDAGFEIRDQIGWAYGSGFPKSHNGPWGGSALKPAWEPICMARKPLVGTIEANWREHGVGALNIDGCRIGGEGEARPVDGRWPANLIHDGSEEVLAAFPDSDGSGAARKLNRGRRADSEGWGMQDAEGDLRDAGSGSAARFFYCAKTSKKDRGENNTHPTVKPTDLMRHLCRLVTPPGGLVLDPFVGSGSTGKAAVLEGFRFVGCDLSPEYIDIAERRIATAVFGSLAFGASA